MSVTINNVQVEFHLNPPKVTYLQGCDMNIYALQDAFRLIEETEEGRMQPTDAIISASGNEAFSSDGSVTNALTVTIEPPYVQAFEAGPIPFQTSSGNLLGTFIDSPGAIVQINNAVGSLNVNSADIEYASFSGGVTVDTTNGYSLAQGDLNGRLGDGRLIGTPRAPVNNFSDGLTIATARGFIDFFVLGDATIDTGLDYSNYVFHGQGQNLSDFTVSSAATVLNCTFFHALVTGTLDGDSQIENCIVDDLLYVSGVVENCILNPGEITLGGNQTAHFISCESGVPGAGTPVINCGGSGQPLAMRNYNGGIALRNKSGGDSISIDLNSGQVILENTVTSGTIVIRGVGKVIDQNGDRIGTGSWNGANVINETVDSRDVQLARKLLSNRVVVAADDATTTIYDDDGTTVLWTFTHSSPRHRTPA